MLQTHRRPPSLNLISISSTAGPVSTSSITQPHSQSPFRFVQFEEPSTSPQSAGTPLSNISRHSRKALSTSHISPPSSSSKRNFPAFHSPRTPLAPRSARHQSVSIPSSSRKPSSHFPYTPLTQSHSQPSHTSTGPRCGHWLLEKLRPWIPILMYASTSLGFVLAIACWREKVFTGLDNLSRWLRADEHYGLAVIFCLIFLTTFPPLPLYSTLITLSGYTFGPWIGAVVSYFAALTGALVVFTLSRSLFREQISRWLNSASTIKRVVRAIEKRPKLLFLIRLAPYPYNVMNCLLAASPTLTLQTYTICTALSLFKVIIHTSLGASIHSFRQYHVAKPGDDANENPSAKIWTVTGAVMCIAILIYLSIVARRAVDDELEDEPTRDMEERVAFLSEDVEANGTVMTQTPFRSKP